MKKLILLSIVAVTAFTSDATAQNAADSAAIRHTALDYIEGWYAGDGARMERSLHPELAKRNVSTDRASGRSRLTPMGALTLINSTKAGGGTETPQAERRTAVYILDIYEKAASVKVDAGGWVDYMHMAKWYGQWRIINVLWENAPRD